MKNLDIKLRKLETRDCSYLIIEQGAANVTSSDAAHSFQAANRKRLPSTSCLLLTFTRHARRFSVA
jgi:hypothetical protein